MTKSRNLRAHCHRWTDDQVDYLRRHYADALTVNLAAALGLRAGQIVAKANGMGLHKSHALPVGSHRIISGGYLNRKTRVDGEQSGRWQPVHRLLWIDAHGEIPAGHIVVFKPGRRAAELAQITLDAIELVTRAENMRRNSHHTNYPPELRTLVQLRGALTRQINRKAEEAETT